MYCILQYRSGSHNAEYPRPVCISTDGTKPGRYSVGCAWRQSSEAMDISVVSGRWQMRI